MPDSFFKYSRQPLLFLGHPQERQNLDFAKLFQRELHSAKKKKIIKDSNIEFTEESRVDEFGRFTHCGCVVTLEITSGRQLVASGLSNHRLGKHAKFVAFIEALERLAIYSQTQVQFAVGKSGVLDRYRISKPFSADNYCVSNGVAVHSSPDLALKNAICESLERDAFLANWYSGYSLPEVSPTDKFWAMRKKALSQYGWSLKLFSWTHQPTDTECCAAIIFRTKYEKDRWNFFIGGGADYDFAAAADSAFWESLRQWRYFNHHFPDVDTHWRPRKADLEEVMSRMLLYQQKNYYDEFLARTFKSQKSIRKKTTISGSSYLEKLLKGVSDLTITPLPLPEVLHDKLFCVKASSQSLQDLDWNVPATYNVRRIGEEYGVEKRKFCKLPHPIS